MSTTIKVNLDLLLVKRKMTLTELADKVGITLANLSILKRGKARAIRFSTLAALCDALNCTPGDLLEIERDEESNQRRSGGDLSEFSTPA